MKVLTVVIAAYNVEKYLESTLKSLCDARYIGEIEVLVVDDGSKDRTGEIAKHCQQMHPESVRYIAKENGGHGSTINKGIELATGKYFRVVDGDDAVDPDAFSNYIEKLQKCDSDVVVTDYWWTDDQGVRYPHNHAVFGCIPAGKKRNYDKSTDSSLFGLSTMCIRTELLRQNHARITEHCYYVDVEFIVWAIAVSRNYIFYDDKVYLYRCVGTGNNSVNKANMLRNVEMQETVALNLCALLQHFEEKQMLDEDRRVLILNRIAMSIGALYRTWLLCDKYQESRDNIRSFEQKIQESSKILYRYIGEKKFIRWIRKNQYAYLGMIRIAYRGYLQWKKKVHWTEKVIGNC